MNEDQIKYLKNLYRQYNDVIKPLIALWESREEKFMTPILNEIRSFNDHIARCYLSETNSEFVESQLKSASRHIVRLILDCYKYLNLSFNSDIEKFEQKTKIVDLSIIDNGDFYIAFKKLRSDTIEFVRQAKILESKAAEDEEKYKAYEKAFNSYVELSNLIDANFTKINWAKAKSLLKKYSWIIAAIVSGLVSVVLANLFGCGLIKALFSFIFK